MPDANGRFRGIALSGKATEAHERIFGKRGGTIAIEGPRPERPSYRFQLPGQAPQTIEVVPSPVRP